MKKIYCIFFYLLLFICSKSQDIPQQLDRYLSGGKNFKTFNGTALVVYKGNILLYKGYGHRNATLQTLNDTATIYRIGSITKPFTATLIQHFAEQKLLSVHDPLSKYIPGYPNADSITIEHLLTHSSGVKDYLEVPVIQQLPDSAPPISMEQLISTFKNEPAVIKPGEKFAYSNSNYILLACIIEKITGKKYEQVIRDEIFNPLHMDHAGFDFKHLPDSNKATGHINHMKKTTVEDFDSTYAPGCGAMFATAMDLYKFYKGLYAFQVISDSTRENAFIPRQWMYGYGWFGYTLYGKKCISHPGGVPGFVADLKFFPDDDLCIILLNNSSQGKASADKLASIVFQKRFENSGL
jgi:CubicO group peptidase (beta-lactamase class C family)